MLTITQYITRIDISDTEAPTVATQFDADIAAALEAGRISYRAAQRLADKLSAS